MQFLAAALVLWSGQALTDHAFALRNGLGELDLVSVYVWETGTSSKGGDRLSEPLAPGCSVTLQIPSGRCNLLAFDQLGNSYGIQGLVMKSRPDTLSLDLQHMTNSLPNFDHGHYMVRVHNSLTGLHLDSVVISSPRLNGSLVMEGIRIFPGAGMIVWLEKGDYSVRIIDGAGREFRMDGIEVPSTDPVVRVTESAVEDHTDPIGIVGSGRVPVLIVNYLPFSPIEELAVKTLAGVTVEYLDSLSLPPSASLVASLDQGSYLIVGTDAEGAGYSSEVTLDDGSRTVCGIDPLDLVFDFEFPERPQHP